MEISVFLTPPPWLQIIGHELVGHVHEVGSGVKNFKEGDYVVSPFTMSW